MYVQTWYIDHDRHATCRYHYEAPGHLELATELASRCSIRVHLDPTYAQQPILPGEDVGHFDDIVFMQQQIHAQGNTHAVGLPTPTDDQECTRFQFSPAAAIFQPGLTALTGHSEFEQESTSALFITWLVDHRY